jgi:hypothetical protein
MTFSQNQEFETFVPVYDTVPEKWEDAREFLVEHLKKISNAVNIREVGWYLDEELLSGKQFIPGPVGDTGTMQQFRSVLRKVVDVSPLVAGVNPPIPHGITVDANFTLIDMWVAATDSVAFTAEVITDSNVNIDANDINIMSPAAFDRAFCFIEYCQEV